MVISEIKKYDIWRDCKNKTGCTCDHIFSRACRNALDFDPGKYCQCVCHKQASLTIEHVEKEQQDTRMKCGCNEPIREDCNNRYFVNPVIPDCCDCLCHKLDVPWEDARVEAIKQTNDAQPAASVSYNTEYLGKQVAKYTGKLDLIKWDTPERVTISLTGSEFSSLCPVTNQPDYAKLTIIYVPVASIVETKSFKLYLQIYRDLAEFNERICYLIAKDFFDQVKPFYMRIDMVFNVRGGVNVGMTVELPQMLADITGKPLKVENITKFYEQNN